MTSLVAEGTPPDQFPTVDHSLSAVFPVQALVTAKVVTGRNAAEATTIHNRKRDNFIVVTVTMLVSLRVKYCQQ
jgi:hypothetical protein